GRFELRDVMRLTRVDVWTLEGQHQFLRVPLLPPGGRVDGLELRLLPELRLELELVDEHGSAAEIPAPSKLDPSVLAPWRSAGASEPVAVIARGADGARLQASCPKCDAQGVWKFRFAVDPASIGELEIDAAGYLGQFERSSGGFPLIVRRKLALERTPTFR